MTRVIDLQSCDVFVRNIQVSLIGDQGNSDSKLGVLCVVLCPALVTDAQIVVSPFCS